MKKISSLAPGTIFTYASKAFVVLEQLENGVFCLLAQSEKSAPFRIEGAKEKNNYRYATLRSDIEDAWVHELLKGGAKNGDLLEFEVDLRPTDLSEGYGHIKALAAPLTLWQYGKYKNVIPLNESDWWWLVTPRDTQWLHFPFSNDVTSAWNVRTNGSAGVSSCTAPYGIRPAVKLNSELIVHVDGEGEDERPHNQPDNVRADLSRVDTITLVREVERRIAGGPGSERHEIHEEGDK